MQGRHRYGPRSGRLFHRERRQRRGRRAGGAAARALGGGLRQAHRRGRARRSRRSSRSVDALERCGATMQELLAEPLYRRHLEAHGRRQCVLIGYSDSNKESGTVRLASAIHQAQRDLAHVLAAAGEQHVLFHARGGSMARGGGRIDALVRAAPAGAVNGVLRISEQGETVNQSYGLRPIAMRTLERAFNALASRRPRCAAATARRRRAAQLECAALLAEASRDRLSAAGVRRAAVLRVLPGGHADRRDRTHADRLTLGASLRDRRGIAGLLPVPWVFAWTQSRHMLPGWYGAGSRPRARRSSSYGLAALREAYRGLVLPAQSHRRHRDHAGARRSRDRRALRRARPGAAAALLRAASRRIPAGLRAGARRSRKPRAAGHPIRPCSARSVCAIPTSIR